MAAVDIGIDLGTTSILVYAKGKGVVLKEPAVVAYDKDADRVRAIGEEAKQLIGRTSGNISAIHPLKEGTISDYLMTERMLRYFVMKAMGRRAFRKPRICICVPSGITEVEKKAVEEATYQAGAKEVILVEEQVAAAIGSGLDLSLPFGNLIVDIGGGTTDIAVVSLGDIVVSSSIKAAGSQFDKDIVRYFRKTHNLFIGEQSAEAIKIKLGCAYSKPQPETMEVTGRNIITGLPKTVTITSEDVRVAMQETSAQILEAIHRVLESTPPELAVDIAERGIILTGGGALMEGLEELISSSTGINTMTADNPVHAVAIGTGHYLEIMEKIGRI